MNYTINEIISLIEKELINKKFTYDVREHLLSIYLNNGKIVAAFREDDITVLRDSIGNLFLSLILISEQYDVDCNTLEWDDEGLDISTGYTGFYKEMILLNSTIGDLSKEVYAIQYANINTEISREIEGVLEKISNIACVSSVSLEEVAYLAYENWKNEG